ncbi:hypothetical protein vseg_015377 [Gypsophila vaccaria]
MGGNKWKKPFNCLQTPTDDDDNDNNNNNNLVTNLTAVPYDNNILQQQQQQRPRRASDVGPSSSSSTRPRPRGLLSCFNASSSSSSSSSSSKQQTCEVCSCRILPELGSATFTAECSHSFHFVCITNNLKRGNRTCPVCLAQWKEIPLQIRTCGPREKLRGNMVSLTGVEHSMISLLPQRNGFTAEPEIFDDDDVVIEQLSTVTEQAAESKLKITTCPEVSAISNSNTFDDFTVLIHLKAPSAETSDSRAPVDLVTVLDVSGSMTGTKLALLKQAMGFVIQHLGPHDRLSVVAFSSTARRLFPLRRMTDTGRSQALEAVNYLFSNGGTNMADGLRKGAKVMIDRKFKNAVCRIILLSDGQDTYAVNGTQAYMSLFPSSDQQIPVHTFGLGADHDAAAMHSISECSGGTFSFIEVEGAIKDAFAQCMGGLLSVVTQELKVSVESSLQLRSIKAGSYRVQLADDAREGLINVGDLYAEEERDFLVTMNIPVSSADEMLLLKAKCTYRDPLTNDLINMDEVEVKIDRPEIMGSSSPVVAIEVDRQHNRLRAAKAMSEAKSAAESGDLAGAMSIVESCREIISTSTSAQAGDSLSVGLGIELKEMQERMSSLQVYEASGRAYVLSGLSSHSWQRATTRGDTTSSTDVSQVYQTTMMADMITRSQTMVVGDVHPR